MTLANKITSARFFVTLVYLGALTVVVAEQGRIPTDRLNGIYLVSFVLFLLAAGSDWIDGYFARKYGQVTHFGRIADPFVDKIIVCGSLTFFLSIEPLRDYFPAWLVVIVLGREFLVHGIRSVAEAQGIAFGANFLGKVKLVVQAFTVGTALWAASYLHGVRWTQWLLIASVGATLVVTVASGAVYVVAARKLFTGPRI